MYRSKEILLVNFNIVNEYEQVLSGDRRWSKHIWTSILIQR